MTETRERTFVRVVTAAQGVSADTRGAAALPQAGYNHRDYYYYIIIIIILLVYCVEI